MLNVVSSSMAQLKEAAVLTMDLWINVADKLVQAPSIRTARGRVLPRMSLVALEVWLVGEG